MTIFQGFPKQDVDYAASDVGHVLAGFVARDGAGNPKPGMLGAGPGVTVVGASWKCEVTKFIYVSSAAGAAVFTGLSEPEQVEFEPATDIPAGQSRIDRLCWNPSAEQLVVVQGVPGTAPAAPSIGVNAPVARVVVQAGDGVLQQSRVVNEFVTTSLAGGEKRRVATSSVVHSIPGSSNRGRDFSTGLAPQPYERMLVLSNGDVTANTARFELATTLLPAGSTTARVAWVGGHAGMARMNFVAIPVEG